MRRGVFDEYEGKDGARVYRLRWVEEPDLSPEELARGRFIQYRISRGKLSEGPIERVGP